MDTTAQDPFFKLALTPYTLVLFHLVASFFSTVCFGLAVFGLRDKLTTEMIRESLPNFLKVLTVYLIIWVAGELALAGSFNQGISTLFAAIIGYVFGSYKTPQTRKNLPTDLPTGTPELRQ